MYKYACEFTITGRGYVPVDMMRYDRCTPLTQEDASKMNPEHKQPDGNYSVTMIRFTETQADKPTAARWSSFGWQVSEVKFRKLS